MKVQLTSKDSLFFKVLICLLLSTAICIVYWQVIGFEFIKLDDPRYVTENPTIKQGITLQGIRWALVSVYAANWHPLTWMSHMLDVQLYGMNPGMHHFTNVLFHIINTLLLLFVLEKMTGALWRSAAVAALFALHPLHVESVAWISERKDVLSAFFWMLTMMGYLWYLQRRSLTRYLAVVVSYILGLLSKPMLVTLPFVLLLLDFWPLKRVNLLQAKDLAPNNNKSKVGYNSTWLGLSIILVDKIPLILLALISSGTTFFAQKSWGAVASYVYMPIGTRIGNAAISYIAYLVKMFYPINLAVFYPYPKVLHLYSIVLCLLLLLLITVLVLIAAKSLPYLMVGWLWYLGTLVPVIGIIQVGSQSMADRYTYIPLIGVFIMIVWGFTDLFGWVRHGKAALGVTSTLVFALLIVATWVQIGFWKNNETLFRHALQVTNNNDVAHLNVGYALFDKGDVDSAIKHYREALQINPANPKAYINLGEAFETRKDTKTAIGYYLKGLELDPNNADAHTALGTLFAGVGNTDEAVKHFNEALKINHGYIEAHNNLGNLMLHIGNYDEAIKHYTEALSIDPHQAEIYNNLGTAFIYKGDIKKAIESYQDSLREKPDYAGAVNNLKNARINQKILAGLLVKTQGLVKSAPRNPALHTKLGDIYRHLGEFDKAVDQYNNAISIQPKCIQAMNGLVLVYTNLQEYTKALDVLQGMKQIQPGNPEVYYNIACIYAKQNMSDKSIEWLKQSIEKGFHDWDLIKRDPDLASIRNTTFINELIKTH
jgi:tetratricopeptide (TPR) repeat protein